MNVQNVKAAPAASFSCSNSTIGIIWGHLEAGPLLLVLFLQLVSLMIPAVPQCAGLTTSNDNMTTVRDSTRQARRMPQAIIVGVKKGGTRALLEFLRLNPAIKAPGPEVHFFDKNFHNGFKWYRDRMPLSNASEVTVEKTPAYFISKTAPQRIFNLDKAMKIIVVVRNPITRAISDYTQAISKKKRSSNSATFEEMVLGSRSVNATGMKSGVNASWGAIRIGIYHRYIRKWLQWFPLHQMHFVDGERLIANPAAEIRAAERFLNVKPTVRHTDFVVDPIKRFPCVLRKDGSMHCLGKTKGRAHPIVEPEVIELLRQFYEPQNEQFFRLINRRFHW